ncbi:MAG: AAA family ATPase [Candidatus Latescibacteria bacterium]|nr:AAA family ATPase [Candidatus Latescibacterota bacterium]
MATIVDGKKSIPFLRGMLAHYLIEHGFTFQDAYSVADRVRREIQKVKDISADDMAEIVRSVAQKEFEDRPVGDGVFWAPTARQIYVGDGESRTLFSQERLADSLQATGVDHDLAHGIARRIEVDLLGAEEEVIARKNLVRRITQLLKKEGGDDFAERFRTWYRFRHEERHKPLVILIGGASGVGKTSVSVALANQLRISRVGSTDSIRQIMRLMISPDLMPALHASSYTAWKVAGAVSVEDANPVISAFREQVMRVGVGVKAIIARALEENDSIIIDGVHLLPDLLDLKPFAGDAIFVWVNLHIEDEKQFTRRFKQRGKEATKRSAHRYVENIDAILEIQRHILSTGKEHNILAYENTDFEETTQSQLTYVMDLLRKELA